MVMNRRPGLRQAHDEVLQKYDGLIIPTIPSVARKQPSSEDLDVLGFIKEAFYPSSNTGVANLTGHPAISLNVGMTLPEAEEVSVASFLIHAANLP